MKNMNLPNKLTIFRMILIVPFVLLLLRGNGGWFGQLSEETGKLVDYIALAIFVIASLTDLIDGKIARKYNLVTNFGKFMDPLADKLLVSAAMIALVELNRIPAWVVIIIISREFIIKIPTQRMETMTATATMATKRFSVSITRTPLLAASERFTQSRSSRL